MADNYINVSVTSRQNQKVSVSTPPSISEVTATTDTGKLWAKTAEKWAISDTIVENKDYSSKYYANKAKVSEENARVYENAVKDTYNTFIAESGNIADEVRNAGQEGLNSIEASRLDAVDSINAVKNESIATVENKANEASTLVNNGITQINTTKNTAVDSMNTTKTNILKDIEFVADGEKEEIQELADRVKDDIESTGFYMRDDKLYFINSKGEEEEFKSGGGLDNKITNCLLEVPQNIKLELNNGTLTLKAGSKVTVPNGAGVFKEVVVPYDKNVNALTEGSYALVVSTNGSSCSWSRLDRVCSGASDSYAQVTYHTWYDTTNNIVKTFGSDVSKYAQQSLPVCIFTSTTDGVQSIDQVFNGIGYIGSTIWVDKGVKGLIPNGRNEDGTLKNREVVTNKVTTRDLGVIGNYEALVGIDGAGLFSRIPQGDFSYNVEKNQNYNASSYWGAVPLFNFDGVNGAISNFQPKQPVKLVRHDELQECQVVVETYKNGTSWYRIWSDGWCEQGGHIIDSANPVTVTLLKNYVNTNYSVICTQSSLNSQNGIPVVWGKATNSFKVQRFYGNYGEADWQASGYIR